MLYRSTIHPLTIAALVLLAACASANTSAVGSQPRTGGASGPVNQFGNPERLAPAPTTGAITVRDLQTRLYQFADDSMLGRQIGRVGNMKGTDYIAAEVKRLGLLPAGDDGTYFQTLPYHIRKFTDHSRLTVDGNPLLWQTEWVAVPGTRAPRAITNAEVIFGGTLGDSTSKLTAAQAAGKVVVMYPAPRDESLAGRARPGFGAPGGATQSPFADAAAIVMIDLDDLSAMQRAQINDPSIATSTGPGRAGRPGAANAPVDSLALLKAQLAALAPQPSLRITRAGAAKLFGQRTLDGIATGAKGGTVTASLDFVELPTNWARNVVAIIPGSDPKLKYQYVAIGAHNDHVGIAGAPVDKDSVRAFNIIANRLLLANKMQNLDAAMRSGIRVNMDSIRQVHPKVRLDSIRNGADDDGSGSMGVLEIAEAMMAMPVKPKRSTLFVWHTGEEAGLIGSAFYVANPTVPLDSVVAQINIDMIGRGRADDLPGGGPDYLGVVGSFFDSKDLGDEVAAVNKKQTRPLTLDYQYDSTMTWSGYNNIYGRSDHYNYARSGVPIAFFFTGLHGDYHQLSDEAEFIDYPHYARIASYIRDIVVQVGNGPRPRLNGSNPSKPRVITP